MYQQVLKLKETVLGKEPGGALSSTITRLKCSAVASMSKRGRCINKYYGRGRQCQGKGTLRH
jgi:hypothetical protein